MNEEETLEIFKNLILLPYDWKITDKYKGTINFIGAVEGNEAIEIISNLIEKLQKENEELKERIREHTLLISPYYVKENFIPIQKVKDKIEKLKINLVNMQGEELLIYESKIDVLQELLEGRK